ncbi:hypothetical protein X975_08770, partial [Stegodyphus mimosarum]
MRIAMSSKVPRFEKLLSYILSAAYCTRTKLNIILCYTDAIRSHYPVSMVFSPLLFLHADFY